MAKQTDAEKRILDNQVKDAQRRVLNNQSEAWADAETYTKDTCVNNPSEDAVERAKDYAENNAR